MKLFKGNREQSRLVIGICGRSCSGKGVLCDKMASVNRNILLLKMDPFFKRGTSCHYRGYDCIEHCDCIRFDHLIETVRALKKGQSCVIHSETSWLSQGDIEISSEDLKLKNLIVVEGFLLFAEKRLADLFDCKIFIDVSDLNILYRRLLRQNSLHGIQYIYDVIIPVSKDYEQIQKDSADIIFDGNQPKEQVLKEVGKYIKKLVRAVSPIDISVPPVKYIKKLVPTPPHIDITVPPGKPAWKIYPLDLLSDGEWHPIDINNLKDWIVARKNVIDAGEELRGDHFRYRCNQNTGDYEIRLSSKYNMYHYNPP
jgi:uridine kinase